MNPTIRSVTDPGAFRCEADLIAFVSVPDRFGVPVHPFFAAPKEVKEHPFLSLAVDNAHMTLISLMAKNFYAKVYSTPSSDY
jgi:hypothetical protein